MVKRFSESSSSLASPWCVLATYAVDTAIRCAGPLPPSLAASSRARTTAAATREGPSMLISTA